MGTFTKQNLGDQYKPMNKMFVGVRLPTENELDRYNKMSQVLDSCFSAGVPTSKEVVEYFKNGYDIIDYAGLEISIDEAIRVVSSNGKKITEIVIYKLPKDLVAIRYTP